MAQENQNALGFADPEFVLINGSHWQSNAKRRYIQCHAWIAELADIILEDNPNVQYKERKNSPLTPLENHGPLEILKYAENNKVLISRMNPNIHKMAPNAFKAIREIRNKITHKRIDNSDPLRDLLGKIAALCP